MTYSNNSIIGSFRVKKEQKGPYTFEEGSGEVLQPAPMQHNWSAFVYLDCLSCGRYTHSFLGELANGDIAIYCCDKCDRASHYPFSKALNDGYAY